MTAVRFDPAGPLSGRIETASDKSISHRSALFAAMAEGRSRIERYLVAADTLSTLQAIGSLGAGVSIDGDTVEIDGVGLKGPKEVPGPIDVGNCGTLMRLLSGWLAGQPGREWTIDGDASIRRRPIDRVSGPLSNFGALIESSGGTPPFAVRGAGLRGARVRTPVASAQVKGALLLAALLADSPSSITESPVTRDHSERMLVEQGAGIAVVDADGVRTLEVEPADSLVAVDRVVPGDPSSAAFLGLAAILVPGSEVTIPGVCVNPGRIGFFRILERMGASISGLPSGDAAPLGPEPVAEITFRHSGLSGTEVGPSEVPSSIDELPLLALAASFAEGTTRLSGAEELRVKETDRIETVADAIRSIGGVIDPSDDGFVVEGVGRLAGGHVESAGDHRIAMLGAIAGLASSGGVTVGGFGAAAVSYPGFADDVASLS